MLKIKLVKFLLAKYRKLKIKEDNVHENVEQVCKEVETYFTSLNVKYKHKSYYKCYWGGSSLFPLWLFKEASNNEIKKLYSLLRKKKHLFDNYIRISNKKASIYHILKNMHVDI